MYQAVLRGWQTPGLATAPGTAVGAMRLTLAITDTAAQVQLNGPF